LGQAQLKVKGIQIIQPNPFNPINPTLPLLKIISQIKDLTPWLEKLRNQEALIKPGIFNKGRPTPLIGNGKVNNPLV